MGGMSTASAAGEAAVGRKTSARSPMTATSATAVRPKTRTGGPKDGPNVLEHLAGWTLVVVLAMLVSQAGLL
ncbi:hypothetical protein GCM10010349_71460 [Streptomyces flavofungini]|nr:hypothetical protein GCM10010349_71460 [Streptomyces flavofungini]